MASSKNILYSTLIIFGTLLLLLTPAIGRASGESYGWFAPTVEYIGEVSTNICPADKYTLDIALANYSSTSTIPVPPAPGVWYVNLMDAGGNIISSDTYNGQSVSNPICVDPANYYIQVIVNETASIYGLTTPSLAPSRTSGPFAPVAPSTLTSSHFRGYVHLRAKGGASTISNISSIFPDGEALKTTPDFIVRTNEMPSVYGPSTLKTIKVYAYNVTDSTYKTVTVPASGGIATRQISGMPSLDADGPYLWFYHQNFTGTNLTRGQLPSGSWTYNSLPATGITTPLSFIIDTKFPEVNNIVDVKTLSSVGVNQIQAQIKINSQDLISGLAHSALIVKDTITGRFISQVDTVLGKQRDLLELNFILALSENTSYTIIHELTDDAGNVSVSDPFLYISPTVADLDAPTLEVRPATDIGSNQAFIASYISNNGGSTVVERGTCWALQDFGSITVEPDITQDQDSITAKKCLQETSTSTSLFVGSFGFTHLNLPASSTIYYRGFARNGNSIGFSPVSTFRTSPLGVDIIASPTPPIIGALYPSSTKAADSVEVILRFDDTGGTLVNKRAICWDTNMVSLPINPVSSSNCYVDDTLLDTPYTLPHSTNHTFYGIPSDSTIYIKGYVSNLFGSSTKLSVMKTPKKYLDISQPDFDISLMNDIVLVLDGFGNESYIVNFPVSAQDFSNYKPSILQPVSRIVPYIAKLSTLDGTVVDSVTGTIAAYDVSRTPAVIQHNFANVNPGTYQLSVEVNSPESVYPERAASTTAGFNNLRIKLLNLPDPDGGPEAPPTRSPDVDENFTLYFDKSFSRPQIPTALHWDTVLPYNLSCKIYGGSNFGPTAIFSFNPSIDGAQGSVELSSIKNFQTFDLICLDTAVGTGLIYSTSTSIISTGSYSSI